MPQMRLTKKESIPERSSRSRKKGSGHRVLITYEASASPRELLEYCVIQAQAALKGLDATSTRLEETNENEEWYEPPTAPETAGKKRGRKGKRGKNENEQLKEFWCVLSRSPFEGHDAEGESSNRIIASSEAIDRSLTDVKGRRFVERLKESLPCLKNRELEGDVKVMEQTDEAKMTLCKRFIFV